MDDRELLELAAKAADIRLEWDGDPKAWVPTYYEGKTYHGWNPLTDDGDALRLAAKLRLDVSMNCYKAVCIELPFGRDNWINESTGFDTYDEVLVACRRAIVRAAAEIAKSEVCPAPENRSTSSAGAEQ